MQHRVDVYHAFVSYSHRLDARLVSALQRALERLGTPWWKRSAVRVFRDDASLPTSAALWPAIEDALTRSQYFVLLASPDAAVSKWVDREVGWWLAHRPLERLLIVVTGGEIAYDARARDFDWQRTDCLPAALRGICRIEPHWTDLRFATGPEQLSLRHGRFRSAALGIAAAVRGLSKDALDSADMAQHRRSMGFAVVAAGALGMLAMATLAAVWVAREESQKAQSNRLVADSRRLAAEAIAQLDGGRGVEAATLKAAIAWRLSPTDDARRALQRIDSTTSDVARVLGRHTGSVRKLAFSRDGERLATVGDEGVVLQWSVADGRAVDLPLSVGRQSIEQLRFSGDGSHLLVHGKQGDEPALAVFRIAGGQRVPIDDRWRTLLRSASFDVTRACAAISPSGAHVAVGEGSALVAIDTSSGAASLHRLSSRLRLAALGFANDGQMILLASDVYDTWRGRTRAGRLDLASGRLVFGASVRDAGGQCQFASFSEDGSRVAARADLDSRLSLWQLDPHLALRRLALPEPDPRMSELTGHHAPEFDSRGQRLAYGIFGTAQVWDIDPRRVLKTVRLADSHGPHIVLSADGRFAAALDASTPIVWRLDAGDAEARRIEGSRCGRGRLEDACIQRLCQKLTSTVDVAWRDLLGADHVGLKAALGGTSCAAQGELPAHLSR